MSVNRQSSRISGERARNSGSWGSSRFCAKVVEDVSRNIPLGQLAPLREAARTGRPVFTMVYDDAASVRVWLDPRDGAPAAPLEMILKDLHFAKEAASDAPGLSAFAEIYANASAEGLGELDVTAIVRRYLPV